MHLEQGACTLRAQVEKTSAQAAAAEASARREELHASACAALRDSSSRGVAARPD